jgi:outer membrane protein TolC
LFLDTTFISSLPIDRTVVTYLNAMPWMSRSQAAPGKNFMTSGSQITQPLTTLLKIRRENDLAQAELKASRAKAQLTGNDVELAVHQVYYQVLIAQAHRSAIEARIKASEALQNDRVEQVKLGSSLEKDLIDGRAQQLQVKQDLLTTDLQLADLKLKLNGLIGLPLTTPLDLDPGVSESRETCRREECVTACRKFTSGNPRCPRRCRQS